MKTSILRVGYGLMSVAAVTLVTACADQKTDLVEACETEQDCPEGQICSDQVCIDPSDGGGNGDGNGGGNGGGGGAVCGNGVLERGELCDTGIAAGEPGACPTSCPAEDSCTLGVVIGEACSQECSIADTITDEIDDDGCCPIGADHTTDSDCSPLCGNGVIDQGEACDDGELNGEYGYCAHDCLGLVQPVCGNGVIEGDEECDDEEETETCNADCTLAVCGDGVLNESAGEQCDDGGMTAECTDECTVSFCGDGIVNPEDGEVCDDGDLNGEPNQCNATCDETTVPVCGNGIQEDNEVCDDGVENGDPLKCNATCDGITDPVCGNSVQEPGEDCDDGGFSDTCNDDCSASVCGDGIVNPAAGEACDDGDDNGLPNQCDSDCSGLTPSICGNGIIEAGETCDDGALNGEPNQCNSTCSSTTAAVCGNGIVEAGESCDDGADNGQPNQCNSTCDGTTAAVCGNGVIEDGEVCDDGADNGQPNMCNSNCTGTADAVCGNGVIEAGETCDDGADNGQPNQCNNTCSGTTTPVCGNNVVEAGEACDDGGFSATCTDTCTTSTCGDGIVNPAAGETCDDASDNGQPNQCNSTCDGITAAVCGNGILESGETCDDGADNGQPNQCNSTCDGTTAAVCGNSVVEAGEDCDDGGFSATCTDTCTTSTCGDGIINAAAGETCDDGSNNGQPNQCNSTCDGTTAAVCGNGILEAGETCDDGTDNGQPNQCNNTCDGTTTAVCGNGIIEVGEDCDDSGFSATCTDTCTTSICGDGIVNPVAGEECDDAGASSTCSDDCEALDSGIFRIESAEIIDPRFYAAPLFNICTNITSQVNGLLTDAFTAPDEDAPGFFNMSLAILMAPIIRDYSANNDATDLVTDISIEFPQCERPLGECFADSTQPSIFASAANLQSAACLPLNQQPGRRTSYTGLNTPTGECFVSEPTSVTITVGDIQLALEDARLVGKYSGDPLDKITQGILMGFLPQSTAEQAIIEHSLLGTRSIASLLGGGPGACSASSNSQDKDTHNGVPGWWFYMNYEAVRADGWNP